MVGAKNRIKRNSLRETNIDNQRFFSIERNSLREINIDNQRVFSIERKALAGYFIGCLLLLSEKPYGLFLEVACI